MTDDQIRKKILEKHFKPGFFDDFEQIHVLEAMEEYKNARVKTLETIIKIKEDERKEWFELCLRKQEIIDKLKAEINNQ